MRLNKQELQAMLKNNQKIPEGWSVKKLGDIVSKISRRNIINNTNVVTISAQKGFIKQEQFFNKSVAGSDLTNYYLLEKGDFGYNRSYSKGYPLGAIKRVDNYDYATVSTLYICFRPLDKVNSDYLLQYFETGLQHFELYKIVQEGARNHGLLNVSLSDFFDIKLILPPLAEQKKIAEILGTWDEAIEKLSSLIEQKKLIKKGLMQKLLTGKVRLPGFTQPWKEVKLGEITEFISGYSFDSSDFKENGVPLIRISNIKNDKISLDNDSVFLDLSFLQKYTNYCIKYGDLLLAMSGATTGKMGVNKSNIPMLLNQRVGIIRAKMSWQSFLNQYLMRFNYKILQMSYGGAQPNIGSNDIKRIKLYIPSDISEQQAIANVLSTADDEINLLNQKLEALKEQKKGLMQQLLTGQVRVKVN